MSELKKDVKKHQWKIDYCISKEIPASQPWAWKEAEEAYDKYIKSKKE